MVMAGLICLTIALFQIVWLYFHYLNFPYMEKLKYIFCRLILVCKVQLRFLCYFAFVGHNTSTAIAINAKKFMKCFRILIDLTRVIPLLGVLYFQLTSVYKKGELFYVSPSN